MSVFADILVLAVLIAAAWLGAKRGLLKSLAGLLIIVVALLGGSWAADHLSEPVTQWIEPRVTQRVERKLEESHAADAGQMLQAFSFRGSGLQKMLDAVHQRVQQTGETVIRAVAAGKVAADNIDAYLGFDHKIHTDVEIPPAHLTNSPPCGRVNLKNRHLDCYCGDFTLLKEGMTLEEAQQEAGRCLRCDHFGYGIFKGGRTERW